jgi:hypothetical protein
MSKTFELTASVVDHADQPCLYDDETNVPVTQSEGSQPKDWSIHTYNLPGNKGNAATQPSTHMNAIIDNAPTTKRAMTVGLDHENVEPPPLIGTCSISPDFRALMLLTSMQTDMDRLKTVPSQSIWLVFSMRLPDIGLWGTVKCMRAIVNEATTVSAGISSRRTGCHNPEYPTPARLLG